MTDLGRSSDVGSFTIWTHHLKGTTFDPLFVPAGAPADHVGVPALVAAAGTSVHEVYAAADAAGVIAAAGTSGTVGAAGGWYVALSLPQRIHSLFLLPMRNAGLIILHLIVLADSDTVLQGCWWWPWASRTSRRDGRRQYDLHRTCTTS